MKKLVSAQALAVASLAVAFPLAASANSASLEKVYERLHQPLNTQSSGAEQSEKAHEFVFEADVHSGESHAMNAARQRIKEATDSPTNFESETIPYGRDW